MEFVKELINLLSTPTAHKILWFLLGYFVFAAIVDNVPQPAGVKNPFAKFLFGFLHTLAGNLKNVARAIKVPGADVPPAAAMAIGLLLIAYCLSPIAAQAQNFTSIVATNIQSDVSGVKLVRGQVCALPTDQNDVPLQVHDGAGGIVSSSRPACGVVSAGAIAATYQVANAATTNPAGIYYRIQVFDRCAACATKDVAVIDLRKVPNVSGATWSLDSYVPTGTVTPPVGNAYWDIPEIATPGNPATGFQRFYASLSTHLVGCLSSAGANCNPASGGGGGGITSLNSLTGASQTFGNDANVTIVSGGTAHVVTWVGTLAKPRQNSATAYNDQANIFGAGFKQTFTPSATTAGANHAPVTSDPSSPTPGDFWLRGDLSHMRFRDNAGTPATHSLFNSDDNLPGAQVSGAIAGNAGNVSGTVGIANGGTGQTTQQAAIDALSGTQSSGKYLRSDGVHATLASILAGDVPTLNQSTTGNSGTATALAANGSNCSSGNYPLGVDASGNAETCTVLPVTSVFGRTGAIVATSGDYTAAQVTNAEDKTAANTLTNVVAPGTPSAGFDSVYADSTDKRFHDKNDAGTIGTTVVAKTAATHKFFNVLSAAGVLTDAQPDFADLTGQGTCPQEPALTGDVTSSAGSCATVLGNIPDLATQAGSILATNIAAPAAPAAGKTKIYVDSTSKKLCSKDDAGSVNCTGAAGGGTPGGTGTEVQYRAGASTFGAVPNTAIVNGGTNTLAAALAANAEITIPADVTQTTSALAVSTADTFLKFLSGRKLTQTTNGVDVIQVTGARFGLFGATLDCNSNTSPEYALKVNADYTNVERSTVQNCGANGGGNGLIAITGGVNHRLVRNRIFTQTAANSEYGIRVESVDAPISGTDVSHNYIEVFSDRKGIFIKQNTANAMSDVTASFNTIHHTGTGIDVHSDSISAGPLGVKLIANGFTATGVSGNPVVSIFGMRSSILSLNTMSGAGFFNNNAPFLTAHDTYESAIVGNAGYMVGTTGRLLQSLDAAHNTFVGNSGFGTSAPSGGGAFEGATSSTAGVPWSDNDVVGNNVNLDTGAGVDCFLAWPNSNNGTSFRNQFTGNNCDGDSTAGSKGVELKLGSGTGISAGDNFVGPNKLSNLEQGVVVGAGVTNTTILPQSFTNVPVRYNVSSPSTQLAPVYHAGEQDFYPTTSATATAVIPAVMETPPLAPKLTCANSGGSLATNTIFVQYVYNNGTSNYSAPSTEASCAVTGPSGQVTVTAPIYFPPNATGWSVFDSSTTGTASKKLQAASSACQNLSSASNCVINVLAAGAALSTTATASAGPTSCTPGGGDLCLTSSDGSIANNKLTYHDGNSNRSFVYPDVAQTWTADQAFQGRADKTGQASITADTAAINTTETVVVKSAAIPANRLAAGTVIRAIMEGTCTSTVGNASTFQIRIGTGGTTADTLVFTAATAAAATTGTSIPFHAELTLTVRTTGASATASGYLTLINQGVTGISTTATQVIKATMTTFNSTTASNIVDITYKSAATTTTSTFNNAFIEVVYQ
jgi:hypothetical protein